jgi:hypothetical protein
LESAHGVGGDAHNFTDARAVKGSHVSLDRLELSPAWLAVDAFLKEEQNGSSTLGGEAEMPPTV